jgi:FkbM family methyltransferase
MKKIFIDGGARIGEAIEVLLETREELTGCDVYLFECNINHIQTLIDISNNNKKYNFIVKNEAIWVDDVYKDFYISVDRWGDLGCTLLPEKTEKLDKENPINVKCIDFARFLNSFSDNDYIVLKLDIEGAEYDVLNHLIKTNTITKINELYVEFHDIFFNRNSADIKNKLSNYNIICNFNWM